MVQRISFAPASLAGAAALALAAWPAAAHPPMQGCGMGPGMGGGGPVPVINVQGEGRASVAPDLATVSLGVTTQAPTAAQAMADNAARQTAVIEALRAQGVAPADLQTQGLNLSPMQDFSREGQPPVITGYQAQNIVTARIRDLARLGSLLDAMVAAGATDVQGISFSREDAAATEDRARTEAVIEARRRAEVIATAAGMELGPLVSLTDTSMSEGPRPMAMMARAADAEAKTPVESGELTLTAQVTGVWSLLAAGGEAGPCGPQGPMGPHGDMGMHGHGGPHGDMGPHGHMGMHGDMGPRGDRGPEGDRGPRADGERPGPGPGGPQGQPDRPGMMPRPDGDRGAPGRAAGEPHRGGPAPEWQLAPPPRPIAPPDAPQPGADASAPPAPGPDAAGGTPAPDVPQPGGDASAPPAPAPEAPAGAAPGPSGAGATGPAPSGAAGAGSPPPSAPTPPAN